MFVAIFFMLYVTLFQSIVLTLSPNIVVAELSRCRLNTRVKTGPMKLERFEDASSKCLNGEGNGVVDCDSDSAPEWRYYYDEQDFRLQMEEGTQYCYGREWIGDTSEITVADSSTGTTPCPDAEYSAYYALELDGDENNEFKWTQYGFGGDPNVEYW